MESSEIAKKISMILKGRSEILFGYMHGSVLSSNEPNDIDIAIFIENGFYKELVVKGETSIGYSIPLEMDIEKTISEKADVQILNKAPLSFQYRVISNGVILKDSYYNNRVDFEYITRVKYFDFRPRIEEYLREITA